MRHHQRRQIQNKPSLDFHPAPFRTTEQTAIGCTHRVDANDIRPERRPVIRGRSRHRLLPKSHVARGDAAEEHEDASGDVVPAGRASAVPARAPARGNAMRRVRA